MFKMMTGTNMVHVPYRGETPALTDLIGGQGAGDVQPDAGIDRLYQGESAGARIGRHRHRGGWDILPEIPSLGDFVPGYEASIWYGVGAPRSTPVAIIDRLNAEINAALADPKIGGDLARARRHGAGGIAGRVRPADRRRNRQVGERGRISRVSSRNDAARGDKCGR